MSIQPARSLTGAFYRSACGVRCQPALGDILYFGGDFDCSDDGSVAIAVRDTFFHDGSKSVGLIISTDSGKTWSNADLTNTRGAYTSIQDKVACSGDGAILYYIQWYVSGYGMVYVSYNHGTSWQSFRDLTYNYGQYTCVGGYFNVNTSGGKLISNKRYSSTLHHIYHSVNSGSSWADDGMPTTATFHNCMSRDGSFMACIVPATAYDGTHFYFDFYCSYDSGSTFSHSHIVISDLSVPAQTCGGIVANADGSRVCVFSYSASYYYVSISTDYCVSWTQYTVGNVWAVTSTVMKYIVMSGDGNVILIAKPEYDGILPASIDLAYCHAFISVDGGAVWNPITVPGIWRPYGINSDGTLIFTVAKKSTDTPFADNFRLYKSTDFGANWSATGFKKA